MAQDEEKIKNLANTLEQSVETHDKLLGDELRKVELLDRRRVCYFIKQWSKVLCEEAEGMEAGLVPPPPQGRGQQVQHLTIVSLFLVQAELGRVKAELDQLTSDPDKISGTTDNIISSSRPTKTLDELKKIRETGEKPPLVVPLCFPIFLTRDLCRLLL